MKDIYDFYPDLKERDLCHSKADYLRDWCGVSHNYPHLLKQRKALPSVGVLFKLYVELENANQRDLAVKLMRSLRQMVM